MPLNNFLSEPTNALANAYRNTIDMRKRTYGESLMKSFANRTQSPITESDFSEKELAALNDLIRTNHQQKMQYFARPAGELLRNANELEAAAKKEAEVARLFKQSNSIDMANLSENRSRLLVTQAQQLRDAAQGKAPTDFSFDYKNYGNVVGEVAFSNDPAGWAQTLGRFRYKVDPATNEYQVYDSYDFNNEMHKNRVSDFSKMSPPARMANALADTLTGNRYALGEAYLSGPNAVPVAIRGKIK